MASAATEVSPRSKGGAEPAKCPAEPYRNIIGDPNVASDLVLATVFTNLDINFTQALCCVSRHWRDLALDPCWKPDLLLYSWGDGVCCGRGTEEFVQGPRLLERFYSPSAKDQIVSVACSDFVTLALSASGIVYRWGCVPVEDPRPLLPHKMSAFHAHRIVAISASCPGYYHGRAHPRLKHRHHAAALADDGTFFMWGWGSDGQLFLGDQDPKTGQRRHMLLQEPEVVECFAAHKETVLRFSCGINITAVQTRDQEGRTEVHCAGDTVNTYRARRRFLHTLYDDALAQEAAVWQVPELKGLELRQLVCGGFFACAIDAEGRLWTWGSPIGADHSNGNLLGHGLQHYNDYHRSRAPAQVVSALPGPVRSVSASSYSCMAITEDGKAFTWGDCDGVALGHRTQECHEPVPVQLPKDAAATRAGSLAYTNGALGTETGQLYMWGGQNWEQGISHGVVDRSGLPREMRHSVAQGYCCENLVLGHNHAYIIARKLPAQR